MADITLISGSTLGGAEYVAEHLAEKLEEAGFTTETLHGPLFGAKQTGETLKINILDHDIPEDPAEEWLGSWINLLK